nr:MULTISPECIES: P44/Msp2 family outer membrane protein [Anaplasma]
MHNILGTGCTSRTYKNQEGRRIQGLAVGLTAQRFQPQLTCRLKAGVNYNIARNLTAFIGGTASKALGTNYDNT